MNKIQEVMEKGVEEFKGKLWSANKEFRNIRQAEWLKSHQKALLEAMLEEVMGKQMKLGRCYKHGGHTIDNYDYNYALQDIETIINKAIGV